MPIVPIHPRPIVGRWLSGVALDLHTTSSTAVGPNQFGHMQFDTARPEIAELLFRLKNRSDREAAESIIETAADYLAKYRSKFDVIIPVPPSQRRAVQPVIIVAEGIGRTLGLPVLSCIGTTRSTTQLKNVTDPEERKKHLEGLYTVNASETRNLNVLLFDDLFRSGSTMNVITELLMTTGNAASVRALTITKTRSNQ